MNAGLGINLRRKHCNRSRAQAMFVDRLGWSIGKAAMCLVADTPC
jgi:hypothetical protein